MLCRCALCAAAGVLRRIAAYCIDNGRIGGSPSDRRHGAVAYRTRRTALHDTVLIVLLRCMIKPVRARARLRLVGKARSGCSCCCCTARIHPPPQQAGRPSSAARPLAASRIAPHLSLVPRPPVQADAPLTHPRLASRGPPPGDGHLLASLSPHGPLRAPPPTGALPQAQQFQIATEAFNTLPLKHQKPPAVADIL